MALGNQEVSELFYSKRKDGRWEVKDKQGNAAIGLTKEKARNQYYALYKMSVVQSIDFSKFIK